jgi:rhamnogalacturonan endolyase
MRFFAASTATLALSQGAYAAFGLTSSSSRYIVDTDGGLVFEVNRCRSVIVSRLHFDVNHHPDPTATLRV